MTTKILELFGAKLDNTKDDYSLDELKKMVEAQLPNAFQKKPKKAAARKK